MTRPSSDLVSKRKENLRHVYRSKFLKPNKQSGLSVLTKNSTAEPDGRRRSARLGHLVNKAIIACFGRFVIANQMDSLPKVRLDFPNCVGTDRFRFNRPS